LHSAPPNARVSAIAAAIFCIHLLGDLWSPSVVGALADVASLDRAMLLLPSALGVAGAAWWAAARAFSGRAR
jgi:hypothetical protein